MRDRGKFGVVLARGHNNGWVTLNATSTYQSPSGRGNGWEFEAVWSWQRILNGRRFVSKEDTIEEKAECKLCTAKSSLTGGRGVD